MGQAGSLELMNVIGPQYVQTDTHSVSVWLGGRSPPTVRRRAFLPTFPPNLTGSHIMASRARLVRFGARALPCTLCWLLGFQDIELQFIGIRSAMDGLPKLTIRLDLPSNMKARGLPGLGLAKSQVVYHLYI